MEGEIFFHVIPREGVERLHSCRKALMTSAVIPREGVERTAVVASVVLTASVGDPERGS